MASKTYYYIGLDLGQSVDYTALAVAERHKHAAPQRPSYDVRHLQRFPLGTGYPDIVDQVGEMLTTPPLAGQGLSLVVDATGVGAPVVDLLRRARLPGRLVPVTITGGDSVNRDRAGFRVPKRDLISSTKVLLQSGRLRFAELPETPILVKELLSFQVKIDPATAHDSYAVWREGIHDDLVLAVALAVWFGERSAGGGVLRY